MARKRQIRNQAEFLRELVKTRKFFKEGDRVRIDIDRIKSRKSYANYRQDYKEFLEANKDKIFTVMFDEAHTEYPTLVCLAEDENRPRTLFSEQDLLLVVGETEKRIC